MITVLKINLILNWLPKKNQSSFDKDNEYTEEENSSEKYNEIYSEELADELDVPVAENPDESLLDLERIKDIKEISPDNNMERNTHEIITETLGRD